MPGLLSASVGSQIDGRCFHTGEWIPYVLLCKLRMLNRLTRKVMDVEASEAVSCTALLGRLRRFLASSAFKLPWTGIGLIAYEPKGHSQADDHDMAVSISLGPCFEGVLTMRALLLGVCIRASDSWQLPQTPPNLAAPMELNYVFMTCA